MAFDCALGGRTVHTLSCCVALLATSCGTLSTVQRAQTVGKGHTEVAVEPGATLAFSPNGIGPAPLLDASVRHGVSGRVDLGIRFGAAHLEAQAKVLLTGPENPRLAVSLVPTVGVLTVQSGFLNFSLPLLIGLKQANGNELIIGPRLQSFIGASGGVADVGLSLGYAVKLTDTLSLMPEYTAVMPLLNLSTPPQSVGLTARNLFYTEFKVGLIVGPMNLAKGRDDQP